VPEKNPHAAAVYQQLCENYRAIDDFRTKLLGLLPFASAAGIGALLSGAGKQPVFLGGVGAFGFLVTLGLFSYELHGMKKCGWLIRTGSGLESYLGVQGPFSTRPERVAGFIDEPFAASVIYPATLAAWTFLALVRTSGAAAFATAGLVFVLFLFPSLALIRAMAADLEHGAQYQKEPKLTRPALRAWLHNPVKS
jgi:hypothetical protein